MKSIVTEVYEEFRSWHAVRLVMACLARNVGDACRLYWNDEMRKQGRGTRDGRR